jgi:hypothetical protein
MSSKSQSAAAENWLESARICAPASAARQPWRQRLHHLLRMLAAGRFSSNQ